MLLFTIIIIWPRQEAEDITFGFQAERPQSLSHNGVAPPPFTFPDDTCKSAFLKYMNDKACDFELSHTRFADASGYIKGNSAITPRDAIALIAKADELKPIHDAWGKAEYLMHVLGPNERTDTIRSGPRLSRKPQYHYLGGKTGTLGGCHNAVFICETDSGKRYIAAVINSSWEDRWPDAIKLIDIAERRHNAQGCDVSDVKLRATGALVCTYPADAFERRYLQRKLYGTETDKEHLPASVTKTMTAICMLDFVSNIDDYFCIKPSDLMPGSGPRFKVGDSITFRDALHAMFLPSSNTAAVAVSRIVGNMILSGKQPTESWRHSMLQF